MQRKTERKKYPLNSLLAILSTQIVDPYELNSEMNAKLLRQIFENQA